MAVSALVTLSPRDYDAVLFDLDGVLTPTASVHAEAWKQLFDDFLRRRASENGTPFVPFEIATDYRRHVDGKPRYDGVADFLAARGIELPEGRPDDPPGEGTVHALGNLKDDYFLQRLRQRGIAPYEGTAEMVRELRAQELKTAVVSSSINCQAVLEAAGIADLFDARVDGRDLHASHLRGKPAPDTFLEAARRLRVEPQRAVVVEDAVVGVEAGRAGGFGYVIGVDRGGQSHVLREAGADVIVDSLRQMQVSVESRSTWVLAYEDFDPALERMREALCALGNGYYATRGAAAWARADGVHYPGTYLAGGYNRLTSEIEGRTVENEDLVNFPNWLCIEFKLGDAEWFDERQVRLIRHHRELALRNGVLTRSITFEDSRGQRTTVVERRLVSMADMHVGAMELSITAENWSGPVLIRCGIDGRIVNAGARLYEKFNNRHLMPVSSKAIGTDAVELVTRTSQSQLLVAQGARTRVFRNGELIDGKRQWLLEPNYAGQTIETTMSQGETLTLEKFACLYTARDRAISEPVVAVRKAVARGERFEELHEAHTLEWKHLWRRFDIHLRSATGEFKLNVPMLLRLNLFHLLQAASLNSIGLDTGVPARGWTGEAYEGHIFWDELFIFPTLTFRTPEITRSLLKYRYHRLPEARAAAAEAGLAGAMFPWQSGSDGQEETLEMNFNPRSQRWVPDNSYLQRHVGSAIAWNVWQYFQITDDTEFLQFHGAELMLEIARFWSSKSIYNEARRRYEIHGVMGPDEFHEGYPDAAEPGLDNNAYTNIMAAWVLWRALEVLELLPDIRRNELSAKLALSPEELERWDDISRRMFVPFHDDGIISQFEGYEALAELDWEDYVLRYGNIQRLDLILEAENDSANRYKLTKQADVLMLFYLFSSNELRDIFARLEYPFAEDTIARNVDYYARRSSHGSTLSRVVHAWVLARSDRTKAMTYYAEALQSDVSDIQQGTTAEGIHLGAMAGTVDLVQRVSTGFEITNGLLKLDPRLPEELDRLDMRIRYRGHTLDLRLTPDSLTVRPRMPDTGSVRLAVCDEVYELPAGTTRVFKLGCA